MCLPCHARYMREWRKTHPLTAEQRKKAICRAYSRVLVKRGKLARKLCEVVPGCSKKPQLHHPDYDNPRLVFWACAEHHRQIHRGQLVVIEQSEVAA
jgi:hypothetical protein